jgi:hypothetical protein
MYGKKEIQLLRGQLSDINYLILTVKVALKAEFP